MKSIGFNATSVILLLMVCNVPPTFGGAKIEIDKTKWISVGVGMRASYSTTEDAAPNGNWDNNFLLENLRLYMNGQLHKYIKMEFNTECTDCLNGGGEMIVLDAIGKFEFNDYFNIWAGRLLVPADRAELDGPFFQNTFDFDKTPFYPQDFGNFAAGRFGRDDGVNIWGALTPDKRLNYVVGIFDGLDGGANTGDSPLWAGRFTFHFLDIEKNPGYYTSSTYYGQGGDILTLAFAIQNQAGGNGTTANPGDFTGLSTDLLFEKMLGNKGVVTLEGEYKYFDSNLNDAALATPGCFCLFDGNAWSAAGLYLFPQKVGFGQFQPYVRYTANYSHNSKNSDEFEVGTNYVIDGHNARVSLFYQYGDIATKGRFNFTPSASGKNVSSIKIGLQLQM